MYVPYDERLGVHPQDQDFTAHERWDFEATPRRGVPAAPAPPVPQPVPPAGGQAGRPRACALPARRRLHRGGEAARLRVLRGAHGARLVAVGVHPVGGGRRGRPPRPGLRLPGGGRADGPARPRPRRARRRARRVAGRSGAGRARGLRRHAGLGRRGLVRTAAAARASSDWPSRSACAAGACASRSLPTRPPTRCARTMRSSRSHTGGSGSSWRRAPRSRDRSRRRRGCRRRPSRRARAGAPATGEERRAGRT